MVFSLISEIRLAMFSLSELVTEHLETGFRVAETTVQARQIDEMARNKNLKEEEEEEEKESG